VFVAEFSDTATPLGDLADVIDLVARHDQAHIRFEECGDTIHAGTGLPPNYICGLPLRGSLEVRFETLESIPTAAEFRDLVSVLDAKLTDATSPLLNAARGGQLITVHHIPEVVEQEAKNLRFRAFASRRTAARPECVGSSTCNLSADRIYIVALRLAAFDIGSQPIESSCGPPKALRRLGAANVRRHGFFRRGTPSSIAVRPFE
jgi:hypothetical protein